MTNFESKLKEAVDENWKTNLPKYDNGNSELTWCYKQTLAHGFESGAQWVQKEYEEKGLVIYGRKIEVLSNTIKELERKNELAVKALKDVKEFLQIAPLESGVCCCGANMITHGNPMNEGHSPVDSGGYAIASQIKFIADIVSTLTKSKGAV